MLANLKIYSVLQNIIESVEKNSLTIVSTATGSGKTLGVPISVHYFTGKKIFVTIPRVLIAKSAYNAVKSIVLNNPTSNEIGCLTGKFNSNLETAKVLFCTEQSFINRIELDSNDILIIDEVHEQNMSTEQVLYVAKQHIENGGKVVIMSATMDITRFIDYYNCSYSVIESHEERMFPTEYIQDEPMIKTVIELGGRTLIGVAGKDEMEIIEKNLRIGKYSNPIFKLHSEIEEWDEKEILDYEDDCVIIATSVAMSGITFKDLDNVVPPIKGKRIVNNILEEYVLSQFEVKQWEGRVGRTKKGTVIRIDTNVKRELAPLPEILRADTTEVVLSFLKKGINLNEIKLLNQPETDEINKSFKKLISANIIDSNYRITEIGKFINELGEGITKGYMIYQGKEFGLENFARKCALLIEAGNPFYKFEFEKFRNHKSDIESDHYKIIDLIQSDIKELNPLLNEDFKNYIAQQKIKYKTFKLLKKEFEKIDFKFVDKIELNRNNIYKFFSMQLPWKVYKYGYNDYNSGVQQISNGYSYYGDATPVKLKRGMLMDMTSSIEFE